MVLTLTLAQTLTPCRGGHDDAFGVDPAAQPEALDDAFGIDPDPLPEELDDAFGV